MRTQKTMVNFLGENEIEFYELMQQYRHWPIGDPKGVMEAFHKVKQFVELKAVEKIKDIYSTHYIQSWGTDETKYFIDISKDAGIDFESGKDYHERLFDR
jgi:effector-binding domain-containing protein